ncbi:hypothetical protein J1N35_002189 [Gossypium stocksii]|uniref:Uncharacterized protein n=1 Tax=Gossypium stocksii TaxID=47602 RepID=A0A9D3WKV0_9ROSI|nr:hypothetical protein J1N35_002189 [Gossypium stocksii]
MSGAKPAVILVQHSMPRFLVLNMSFIRSKKGHQSIKEYLGQIKKICDLLAASGHPVSTEEHMNIVLVCLSQDLDSIVIVALFSPKPLVLDRLIEILLECEMRQQLFVTEVLPQENGSSSLPRLVRR